MQMSQPQGISSTTIASAMNVIVFGETGAGKSSLINLVVGRSIAATSSDVMGCTFRHERHNVEIGGNPYAIWDTTGLGEGSFGTVPAADAEKLLEQLLRSLVATNGIHLLVYCVRASRLRRTLLNNYNLFYSAICRKKVPIVAVVTGLENYPGEMENWWVMNEKELVALKMHFDGHACITTLKEVEADSPTVRQRCQASRQAVLALITSACARDHWEIEGGSWASVTLADVRAMFKSAGNNTTQATPVIALYELSGHLLGPIGSVKDTTPFEGGPMDVGGIPFLVCRIHDRHLRAGTRFKKQVVPRGADLLIFCAPLHSDVDMFRQRAVTFYESYGGDTQPLLVVVRDAPSAEVAQEWWNALSGDEHRPPDDRTRKMPAVVLPLPSAESFQGRQVAVSKLQRAIQMRSLQPLDVASQGCFGWLKGTGKRHSARLDMGTSAALGDTLASCGVWTLSNVHPGSSG